MNYVTSVLPTSPHRKHSNGLSAPRRASIQVVTGDVLAVFVREVTRSRKRVRRITLVTPWISSRVGGIDPLESLLMRAEQDGAAVVLVTRPSVTRSHAAAITEVEQLRRGRVFLNDRLHAKLYICEQGHGRGFAVIGSANMTRASTTLDEIAVVLRPVGESPVITELMPTVIRLARGRGVRPRSRSMNMSRTGRPR